MYEQSLLSQSQVTQNNVFELLTLKTAHEADFIALHQILVDCGKHMYFQFGLKHWYPYVPLEQFKERVKAATVYCVYFEDRMIATFNLSITPRHYYQPQFWYQPNAKALYLGNLAIHPEFQGKKVGNWCLQQIEKIAQEMACTAIRFDCVQKHPWLCAFYEKMGYTRGPIIALPEPTGNVICFEKIVNTQNN